MYVNASTIIYTASILSALGVIIGLLFRIFKWLDNQKKQDDEIKELKKEITSIKTEDTLVCYSLMACLDGLEQLGANHTVPKAKEKLSKHLNLEAHDQI